RSKRPGSGRQDTIWLDHPLRVLSKAETGIFRQAVLQIASFTIMFQNGQRVVCIDDQFDPWVYDLYKELPKRNRIYTVRAMGAGRSNPTFSVSDDAKLTISGADFDILLLLVELVNPDDPHSSIKQELGFRAERFAPLQEDLEENEEVELVGFGQESKGWNPDN
nr:hypothetical protein [Verrucomicrobiales bacterium]